MKAFELCVLLFCILIIGILCDLRNTLEKIEKNTAIVEVQKEETIPTGAASIIGKETI